MFTLAADNVVCARELYFGCINSHTGWVRTTDDYSGSRPHLEDVYQQFGGRYLKSINGNPDDIRVKIVGKSRHTLRRHSIRDHVYYFYLVTVRLSHRS
jgi:hypothetical protein